MRRSLFLAAFALSCASTPQPTPSPAAASPVAAKPSSEPRPAAPPPADPEAALRAEVLALEARAADQIRAQAELYWRTWTGGEAADFSKSRAALADLATADNIRAVERLAARTADPAEARALQRLRSYLATEYVAQRSAAASSRLAQAEAGATLPGNGRELPFRDLESLLAAEAHAGRRAELGAAAQKVFSRLRAPFDARERAVDLAARELGYDGERALALALREADPAALRQLAEAVLLQTDAPYRQALGEAARRELNLPLDKVRRWDLPRLLRTGEVDSFFPKDEMQQRLSGALAGLGMDPSKVPGLTVDAEPRPRKSPRALALPVRAPGDVRLSLKPAAGLGAFAQALHETGHALAFAHAGEGTQPFGGEAVGEVWGHLFEGLLDERDFAAGLGIPEAKLGAHLRMSALRRLFSLRRDAGRILFELARREDPTAAPEAHYVAIMGRAWGVPAGPEDSERFVFEHDGLLAAADRLRGQVLAAQLSDGLARRHGATWWRDAAAGGELARLMAVPRGARVQDWLANASEDRLDPAALVAGLLEGLSAGR